MADSKKRLEEINKLLKDSKTTAEEKAKLLKEENSLLKQQIQIQSESLDLSSLMVDSIKEALNINTQRSTADANLLKVNKQINSTILSQVVGITSIADKSKQIAKNQKVINKTKALEASLETAILSTGKENAKERLKLVESASKLSIQLDQEIKKREELLEAAGRGEKIDKDALATANKMVGKLGASLDTKLEELDVEEKKLLFTKNNIKFLEAQNAERAEELKLANKIKEKLGVAGKLTSALGAIPGIGGSAAAALKEVTEELEDAANNAKDLPTKGEAAKRVFKSLGKNLKKDLLDPTTLAASAMKMFVDAIKLVDKEAGALAKDMGISYQESLRFGREMNKVASASGDIAVTQQGLMKAQKSLNEYFGQSAKFSGEIAEEFASIQKRTNLSDKAMGFFTKTAMKGGKDTKSILLNVNKTTLELNKQNKMSLSNKQIQEGIAKLSNTVKLNAKGNVEELTKAVFASKKLGASMAQIEQISSSLLDFESSIQNELQAELLLGKEINLESARAAALRGDQAAVAEEVMKNQAIMNAFETENVIAQEAAAKALGMSRDDLANMVTEQQNLATLQKAYGDDITSMSDAQAKYNELRASGMSAEEAGAKVGDESLANQLETISAAEKMENITARIQQLFMSLAEPVMAIVTPIIDLLVPAFQAITFLLTPIFTMFQGIADILTGSFETLDGWSATLGTIGLLATGVLVTMKSIALVNTLITFAKKTQEKSQRMQALSERKSLIPLASRLGLMVAQAAAWVIMNPFTALLGLGLAAGAGALIYSQMKDGEIDPKKGPTISGEFGTVQMDPKDKAMYGADGKIKVGTDLMGGGAPTKGGGGAAVVQDNAALLAGINRLIAINQIIANKSTVLKVNEQVMAEETTQEQVKSTRQLQ